MIRFSGKIAKEIQANVIYKRDVFLGILMFIGAFVGLLVTIIVWLVEGSLNGEIIKIFVFAGINVLLACILVIPFAKNKLRFKWDFEIIFENGIITVIFNHQNGVIQKYSVSKVKKVVNYDQYYYLYFYKWDASNGIVCQKDLIADGTIEEFEELFREKIVCKNNSVS